jgi:ABC-type multidrug transport system ATPase subunit
MPDMPAGRHRLIMKIGLQAVTKKYGQTRALDRVSLDVAPGQVVALLGSNGAGKTSLLRCLSGISAPDEGFVLYDDVEFNRGQLDKRRRLMFLPDFPFVFEEWPVLRQIGMILRLYEADVPGVEERAIEVLRDLDLLSLAEAPFNRLSRGQRYKASLAALLLADPEVWLLDEPFASGMDPHGINVLKQRTREATNRGRTIIYTTQILEVVEKFADQVGVIHKGELRAFGSLAQIRERSGAGADVLAELFRQLRLEEAG